MELGLSKEALCAFVFLSLSVFLNIAKWEQSFGKNVKFSMEIRISASKIKRNKSTEMKFQTVRAFGESEFHISFPTVI